MTEKLLTGTLSLNTTKSHCCWWCTRVPVSCSCRSWNTSDDVRNWIQYYITIAECQTDVMRWMDELGFYIPSTVFQSFWDDGRMNMKGSVQWSAVLGSGRISPPAGFELPTPWSEVGSVNRSATRTLLTWWEPTANMQQMYKEPKERVNNVLLSSTTWHEHSIVIAENSTDVARMQWEWNAMFSHLHHACTSSKKSILGLCYVVTTSLLSSYRILIQLNPHFVFFKHAQSSTTSCTSIKTISHPYLFLLCFYYVVTVLIASPQFIDDIVGTWPSVTGVLAVNTLCFRKNGTVLLNPLGPATHTHTFPNIFWPRVIKVAIKYEGCSWNLVIKCSNLYIYNPFNFLNSTGWH